MPEQLQAAPTQNLGLLGQQHSALMESAPQIADPGKLKNDLGLLGPDEITSAVKQRKVDPELDRQANEFVGKLLKVPVADEDAQEQAALSVENLGVVQQRKAATANQLLQQPLRRLGQIGGGEGQGIADALTNLKVQFDEIDPSRFNFDAGWAGRVASHIPGVGTRLNRYFTKFESSGKVIEALFDSVEVSRQQLIRDIDTLRGEQVTMRQATRDLMRYIATCQLIDEKLVSEVAKYDPASDEAKYINTKLIFRLRQRITDLQQQLVVNQQGVLMFEVLIENNKELVRGVARCKNVTYPALLIGITAAQALANQKIVLNKIQALDDVGNRTIAFNAKLLATQGIEIHKAAASAQLSDAGLAQAMKDAIKALDDVDTFRMRALEQMGTAIRERDTLTAMGEQAISRMERGNKAAVTLNLDQDLTATGKKNT
jgi:uncharacterized protein YaaN involved in tellurite resistance